MLALLQRVSRASVSVGGDTIAAIDNGLLVLTGFDKDDDRKICTRCVDRVLAYRVFEDEHGHMNRNVVDCNGSVLWVPQFTLVADTRKGNRPGFSSAAGPSDAAALFDHVVAAARRSPIQVERGRFGANMDVSLTNRGPATFILRCV